MPSNFTSAEPYSARLSYNEDPVHNTCATQGAGFLRRLYAAVGVEPMLAWGSELQSALIAKASFFQSQAPTEQQAAWIPLIRALQADLAGTRTSVVGHVFGLYVTYYQPHNRRLDAISLPPSTVLMQWGVPVQDDGGLNDGNLVCIDPANDPPFLTVDAAAVTDSVTGIRMGEGRPVPPSQRTLPNPAVIGAGGLVVIGLLGAAAWWWLGRAARSNPESMARTVDIAIADRKAQQAKRAAQRGDTAEAERLYIEAAHLYAEAEKHARTNPTYTRAQIESMRECREKCEVGARENPWL